MLRRASHDGRGSSQQQKKVLVALSFILLPWLHFADALQQQKQQHHNAGRSIVPQARLPGEDVSPDALYWESTSVKARSVSAETGNNDRERSTLRDHYQHQQQQKQQQQIQKNARRSPNSNTIINVSNNQKKALTDHILVPDDASALATSALASSAVRAPDTLRQWPGNYLAHGSAPPQIARSLEDWEVEDFVLLATVDGDLFANDRRTGINRWHLNIDQPMVETIHHRASTSVLDDDYLPVDHYIWAIEPNRDGGVYIWTPEPDSSPRDTGLSMKKLVEISPYEEEHTSIVYVGTKKTTMITIDAGTGHILKYFGPDASHSNDAESCLRPNALLDKASEECSSIGTITLGRTEYSVVISRKDGKRIATLRYSEWTPNTRDNDLSHQYQVTKDSRYITTQHDGKVYSFDYARTDMIGPLFSQKFNVPVARVFDVCRPGDAAADSNPHLVVLPQPAMPSQNEDMAQKRINSVFLNRTEEGSWYALSGTAYPLIIGAPPAKASMASWWDQTASWDSLTEAKVSNALVGTHSLGNLRGRIGYIPTLPGREFSSEPGDPENDSVLPNERPSDFGQPTMVDKVKSLPQTAADSVVEFIRNPIPLIIIFIALIYNLKKVKAWYRRLRNGGSLRDVFLYPKTDFSSKKNFQRADNVDNTMDSSEISELASRFSVSNKQDSDSAEVLAVSDVDGQKEVVIEAGRRISAQAETKEGRKKDGDDDDNGNDSGSINESVKRSRSPGSGSDETQTQEGKSSPVADASPAAASPVAPEKKKARRGRRGGVKHRKGRPGGASQSRDDEALSGTVDDAVNHAKRLCNDAKVEADVVTVASDMQAISGSVIRMGSIEVNTDEHLGTGSNGTLVFGGKFDGREVAVKRMLIQFYDIAVRETNLLRESDDHPNVIRYYSQQIHDGFLYIALERCAASLADMVEKRDVFRELADAGKLDMTGMLYQIANGISHLHSLRIVHRDLKPQNILVNMGKDGRPRLMVSDFGLCKKLEGGQSSFGATTGRAAGTLGWQAPELLLDDDGRNSSLTDTSAHSGTGSVLVQGQDGTVLHMRRATRAIDIFSLGLVFFYVLTNGSHPFDCGDRYMREVNIRQGKYILEPLDALGDYAWVAKDLVSSMLAANPKHRPSALEIMSHPFFWPAKKRLSFLCDVSDHFEKECRDPPSLALQELERHAPSVAGRDFLKLLPREFVDTLGKQRKYAGNRLLDLLRALRNKRNHYEDLTDAMKRQVGSFPEGYLSFWTVRFPNLLLICWNVVYNVEWHMTDRFREYYEPAGL
ncbi:hypothetical protein E4U42_004051 [Claviceps africana]|uniref:non-specific serine/threonine protein kinase n=1 Tax=Claviceps africana TaxID=83212 RepID=A0A8K0J5R5_9HYPO|nr:hypothetical protein E4U42_004051 [Claviceps africana]